MLWRQRTPHARREWLECQQYNRIDYGLIRFAEQVYKLELSIQKAFDYLLIISNVYEISDDKVEISSGA